MQGSARVLPAVLFGLFIIGGVMYVIRPVAIQRIVARRMERNKERGLSLVAHGSFLWFVRIIGVIMILVGLRGFYSLGIRP